LSTDQEARVGRGETLERGQQKSLARQGRDPAKARLRNPLGITEVAVAWIVAFLDVGRGPDSVKVL
jgi:hypothetical protein